MTDANPATRRGDHLRQTNPEQTNPEQTNPEQTNPDPAQETPPAKLTRFERLKQKIKTLKGDDPDIYPMW